MKIVGNYLPEIPGPVKLGVVGPRDFTNESLITDYLRTLIDFYDVRYIVSGGKNYYNGIPTGVDTFAEIFADTYQFDKIIYPANWNKYGKKAGPMRNTKIAKTSTIVFACEWRGSTGTLDTMTKAFYLIKPVLLGLDGVINTWQPNN